MTCIQQRTNTRTDNRQTDRLLLNYAQTCVDAKTDRQRMDGQIRGRTDRQRTDGRADWRLTMYGQNDKHSSTDGQIYFVTRLHSRGRLSKYRN